MSFDNKKQQIDYNYINNLDESQMINLHEIKQKEKENFNECFQHQNNPSQQLTYHISLSYPNTFILDNVAKQFKQSQYQINFIESNQSMLIIKKRNLFNCLPCFNPQVQVFHVKIKIDYQNQNKELKISCILGNISSIKHKLKNFENEFFNKKQANQNMETLNETFRQIESNLESEQEETYKYSIECSAFSHFYQVMINENYQIGKQLLQFNNQVLEKLKKDEITQKSLRQILLDIYFTVQSVYDQFNNDYNYLKSQSKNILEYCKPSIERFIYINLYDQLYEKYCQLYTEEENLFKTKQTELLKLSKSDLFEKIDVCPKLRLIPNPQNNCSPIPFNNYDLSILELEKMELSRSPLEQLRHLIMSHHLMKTAVSSFHQGKESIQSMDEELPVIIYVMAHVRLSHMYATVSILEDYMSQDALYDQDRHTILNYKVSLQYIAQELLL